MKVVLLMLWLACRGGEPTREDPKPTPPPPPAEIAPDAARPAPAGCMPRGGHACVGDDLVECGADGVLGKRVQACKDGCKAGACKETCAVQGVELIYAVAADGNLMSFDPRALPGDPFHTIGKLACDGPGTPFSMAVDRRGVAWIVYTSGVLYRVSILDAHCAKVGSVGPVSTYGMGFVTDGVGSEAETLFISGDGDHRLAEVDTTYEPPRWTPVGTIVVDGERGPELTGTADARLFGYFPEPPLGFVQEIDRKTAKRVGPRLGLGAGPTVGSWAFAHWGGVFYVFVGNGDTSAVYAVHRNTGAHQLVIPDAHHAIVGAGVSTCAPQLERTR